MRKQSGIVTDAHFILKNVHKIKNAWSLLLTKCLFYLVVIFQLEYIIALASVNLVLHYLIWVFAVLDVECVDTSALWSVDITELGHLSTETPRIIDGILKFTLHLIEIQMLHFLAIHLS